MCVCACVCVCVCVFVCVGVCLWEEKLMFQSFFFWIVFSKMLNTIPVEIHDAGHAQQAHERKQ